MKIGCIDAMDALFQAHIQGLRPKFEQLIAMDPIKPLSIPRQTSAAGIYLLSEGESHLYVGRSNDIKARLGRHCQTGATHRMAAFAFRLAREKTGNLRASYKKGGGSRAGLMENEQFAKAFSEAKSRIRQMDLRYVEESNPVRQTLLEVYVAILLKTPYNDFENH